MSKEKFQGAKYITKGVKVEIPTELQMLMWEAIEGLDLKRDYLQIFKLRVDEDKQVVLHEQEQPKFEKKYEIKADKTVNAKVYVIDSNCKYSTMMLAEEY